MGDCNSCGKCCFIPAGENGELRACPNLVLLAGRYFCRVYKSRLGRWIGSWKGKPFYCNRYNDLSNEIKGCPMNIGGKPIREVFIDEKDVRRALQSPPTMETIGK